MRKVNARRGGKQNLKSAKAHAAAARAYVKSDGGHWTRRILKEMQGNQAVQDRVAKGRHDWALEPKASK